MSTLRSRVGRAFVRALLSGGLLAGLLFATGAPVGAATATVQAGLTITPTTTTVGAGVRVVATATNITSRTLQASLGVDNPSGIAVSGVAGTGGCHPRNLTRLVYCGVQSLAPGATATITFTATAKAVGSYSFRSYARETYQVNDTFAYVTLTAH